MTDLAPEIAVEDLFSGQLLPEAKVLESMGELEQRLTAQFRTRTQRRTALREQMQLYRGPLLEVLGKDARAGEAVAGLRRLHQAAHGRELHRPHSGNDAATVLWGSIGATVAPPFDYQWTWSAVHGKPDENRETADHKTGDMSLHLWTSLDDNSSSISGRAAVGIYFRPPAGHGTLQIWSTPAYTDDWGTWCTLDSASADAWMGLYVASYDLTGAPAGALVDQQVRLWSDSSWWNGVGDQDGSNSGFGLHASGVRVDHDHQYVIWVWIGGDVSADGWGTFTGSGAGDDLMVHVPSITWEYTPAIVWGNGSTLQTH